MSNSFLRSLVKEMILSETPLMDIYPYKGGSVPNDPTAPSIGYKIPKRIKGSESERRKKFTDEAKVLLADSKDRWYIIVLKNAASLFSNTNHAERIVNSKEFDSWIKSLNIPKGSKIIIPNDINVGGDNLDSKWQIVHDVIGHSITRKALLRSGASGELNKEYLSWRYFPEEIFLHAISDEFKISNVERDRYPDIFAAIFANKFDKKIAEEKLSDYLSSFTLSKQDPLYGMTAKQIIDAMYRNVEDFVKSIPFDKPTLIDTFGNN